LRGAFFVLAPATRDFAEYLRAGFLGVEVFFILSGFIIAYQYADKFTVFTVTTYRNFLLLRVARIYPVHLATLMVMLVLFLGARVASVQLNLAENFTPYSFVGNVFMLQSLPTVAAWNVPSWSICCEFMAYLAFPLLALWLAGIKTAKRGFAFAAIVLLGGVLAMLAVTLFVSNSPSSDGMRWLRISVEFTLGCLLFAGWRHLGSKQFGSGWDWAAVGSVLGIIGVIALVGGETSLALLALPFIAIFVLACAGATGWVGRLLSTRIMIWGGKISFSVYMTHFILLMLANKLLPWEVFESSSAVVRALALICYFGAVVAVGAACYHFVEEPARKLIRSKTISSPRSGEDKIPLRT
jgi:peptidoglycan/LPS O-acetylase OafA/YrhL